jgi:hypothetical protein
MKRFLVILSTVVLFVRPSTTQDATVEYQIKAAYLYNFAKFVEWPREAFPDSNSAFTICIIGDPFRGALERTVQNEIWNGRRLSIRRIEAPADVRTCQVVYISETDSERTAEILMAAANAPVLTVGETDDFIPGGGMIRFVENGGRVRFEINPEAAERVSLHVSSRLLRLADIVRARQRAGN